MKYCIHCGREIGLETTICPYCSKETSENDNNKVYNSNIKCINCDSTNVNYKIKKSIKKDIIHEKSIYICADCNEEFSDDDRIGPSFNNKPQLILSNGTKKIIKWLVIFGITALIVFNHMRNTKLEEDSWQKLDCSGLPTMTFKEIKEGAPYSDDKYIDNSYIFTTTIQEINGNEIITPIEEGDYSGSYITINKEEKEKLSNYKIGDKIKFCGTVKKISMYHKVYVKNATIID